MRKDLVSWSLIDPKPQAYYHKASNSHIVYWQGCAMTRAQAMSIVLVKFVNAWPSPETKRSAYENFKQCYWAGAFGEVDWNYTLNHLTAESHFNRLQIWITRYNSRLFETLTKDYSLQQAFEWFLDETVIEDD